MCLDTPETATPAPPATVGENVEPISGDGKAGTDGNAGTGADDAGTGADDGEKSDFEDKR